MSVEYHPAVQRDVADAVRYYRQVSEELAGEFKTELKTFISEAAANPDRFHRVKHNFHRANLKRFPFHIIYREIEDGIRATLIRHNRRDPEVGTERR